MKSLRLIIHAIAMTVVHDGFRVVVNYAGSTAIIEKHTRNWLPNDRRCWSRLACSIEHFPVRGDEIAPQVLTPLNP